MTAPAVADVVDPSGLNGQRITRDEKYAPDVVELWLYTAGPDFDAIERAWRLAPRRPHTLVMSVTPYKQTGNNRFVSVRLYVEPAPAPLHIDEPAV